jgi:hypothetical protein
MECEESNKKRMNLEIQWTGFWIWRRKRERGYGIFWFGYLFPACLWRPIRGTGARYTRFSPVPGAAALGVRRSTRYGRTVRRILPHRWSLNTLVFLPKFWVSSSKWYGRMVRSGLPVAMVAKVAVDFGETSNFYFSRLRMRYRRVVRAAPAIPTIAKVTGTCELKKLCAIFACPCASTLPRK